MDTANRFPAGSDGLVRQRTRIPQVRVTLTVAASPPAGLSLAYGCYVEASSFFRVTRKWRSVSITASTGRRRYGATAALSATCQRHRIGT